MSAEERKYLYGPRWHLSRAKSAEFSFGWNKRIVYLGGFATLFNSAAEFINRYQDINVPINLPEQVQQVQREVERFAPIIQEIQNYGEAGVVAAALGALGMFASTITERVVVYPKLAQRQIEQGDSS